MMNKTITLFLLYTNEKVSIINDLSFPDCDIASLETHNDPFSYRICDGVIDCVNLEDELRCPYCSSNDLHCGIYEQCISRESYCNEISDCPDNSDEKNCRK